MRNETRPLLTARELEVLRWLSRGFTFHETAKGVGLSPHTVGNHTRKIYRKLGVRTRASAVFEAVQWGLLELTA